MLNTVTAGRQPTAQPMHGMPATGGIGPSDAYLSTNASGLPGNVLVSQAHFEEAMRSGEVEPILASAVLPVSSSMPSQVADRILASLRSASADTQDIWNSANRIASVADLLQLQRNVLAATITFSYFGKLINKSTQIVDQLVKTQ